VSTEAVETATREIALRFDGIVKTYPGVKAVDDVSLVVRQGQVHALVGENGAGKSTLMGIAAGVVLPDHGTVQIGGESLDPATPARASALGLAVVYQHASTIADLTIRENLVLAAPPNHRKPYLGSREWVAEILKAGGLSIHPDTRVSSLATAERQLLEIAKALAFDARVILFDEPTESLTQDETERLFDKIHELTDRGTAVVYISHRLADVRHICDTFTVLRDGRSRGTFHSGELTENEIVELMIGRAFSNTFPPKQTATAPESVFAIENFSGERFKDVSFELGAGQILGLAGVEGNGQREFLRAIGGLEKQTGTVTVKGERVSTSSVPAAQRAGIYYLPGDRHAEGLFLPLTVEENASLLRLGEISTAGILSHAKESQLAKHLIGQFDVRTPSARTEVSKLSGGNQQKVLLGRIVAPGPTVLLADEPTRGVDVGARAEIYSQLRGYVDNGASVIVLSSDAVELAGLCDRVVVFSSGRIATTLEGDELTERAITAAAVTAVADRKISAQTQLKGRTRGARFLGGEYLPSVVMIALLIAVAVFTGSQNAFFLSPLSIFNLLIITSVTALSGFGQSAVLLTGGIDLSIGPMISLGVVLASYYGGASVSPGLMIVGVVLTLVAGVVVGIVNAFLSRRWGLPPVLSTLITGIVLQGVALLLRPTPAGSIDGPLSQLKIIGSGSLPYVFLIVLVIGVGLEMLLRWSRWGLELRASGSSELKARSLGARVERSIYSGYVLSAVVAAAAGIILSSVVGIGDASTGLSFTLVTVTVAVLGGTSVFGGRGSIVGVVFAALLLQELSSASTFLRLGIAWQQWSPALLIIIGAAVFSRIRRSQAVDA
jgi:ribose transport system ATP-binding protein